MARDEVAARLEGLARAAVEAAGYEVVQLQLPPNRRLRLMIDVEGGVGIEDCRRASRIVEEALAGAGFDPGGFHIEVESPGVDRPLTRPSDFERFRGARVTLSLHQARASDGRRNFTGTLIGYAGGDVTVHVLDAPEPETFRAAEVRQVRLHPEVLLPKQAEQLRGGRPRSGRHRKRRSGRHRRR